MLALQMLKTKNIIIEKGRKANHHGDGNDYRSKGVAVNFIAEEKTSIAKNSSLILLWDKDSSLLKIIFPRKAEILLVCLSYFMSVNCY